jgi:nicotinamide mononucleotide transporter
VVDVVAMFIYWQKGLYPTALLYFCFLIMAIVGQWLWYKNLNTHSPAVGKEAQGSSG